MLMLNEVSFNCHNVYLKMLLGECYGSPNFTRKRLRTQAQFSYSLHSNWKIFNI